MPESVRHLYRQAWRAAVWGIVANALLGALKLAAGLLGNSIALISDAVNSWGDAAASVVAASTLWYSQKPADRAHPYGHMRAEAIGALTVSVLIIVAAFSVGWQSFGALTNHGPIPPLWILGVAAANTIAKEALFRYSYRVGCRTGSFTLIANAWDHRADALCSLGALLGLTAAYLGGPAWAWADGAAGICIAAIVMASGVRLYLESASNLMDRQADVGLVEQVRNAAQRVPGVEQVEKLWVRSAGLEYFVDIHVQVDPAASVEQGHTIGHQVKHALESEFARVREVLVHLEPCRPLPPV